MGELEAPVDRDRRVPGEEEVGGGPVRDEAGTGSPGDARSCRRGKAGRTGPDRSAEGQRGGGGRGKGARSARRWPAAPGTRRGDRSGPRSRSGGRRPIGDGRAGPGARMPVTIVDPVPDPTLGEAAPRDPGLGPEPRHEPDGHEERPQRPCRQVHGFSLLRPQGGSGAGHRAQAPPRGPAAARAAGGGGHGLPGKRTKARASCPRRERRVLPGDGEEPEGKEPVKKKTARAHPPPKRRTAPPFGRPGEGIEEKPGHDLVGGLLLVRPGEEPDREVGEHIGDGMDEDPRRERGAPPRSRESALAQDEFGFTQTGRIAMGEVAAPIPARSMAPAKASAS